MDERLVECQVRRWTVQYWANEYKEGWAILFYECVHGLKRLFKRRSQRPSLASERSQTSGPSDWVINIKNDPAIESQWRGEKVESEKSSSIVCGINVISKMINCINLPVPAFVLDIQPGLVPSKGFARFSYFILAIAAVCGAYLNKTLIEPFIINTLPKLSNRVSTVLVDVASLMQNLINVFGICCLASIIYLRHSLNDFFLYHCNIISLPKSYLRRKALLIFLTFYFLTLMSKPAFVTLMLILDHKQPEALLHWSPASFLLMRYLLITFILVGAVFVCMSAMIIPLLTTYLVVCSASYLNTSVWKQMSRFSRVDQIGISSWKSYNSGRNELLERLLDDRTRRLILDYSCDTLTCDWPDLVLPYEEKQEDGLEEGANKRHHTQLNGCTEKNQQRSGAVVELSGLFENIRGSISTDLTTLKAPIVQIFSTLKRNSLGQKNNGSPYGAAEDGLEGASSASSTQTMRNSTCPSAVRRRKSTGEPMGPYEQTTRFNSTSNGVFFIQKNLIKILSELKSMITIYEHRFGSFHFLQICLDSLVVAQWITSSLTEIRFKDELKAQRLANRTLSQIDDTKSLDSLDNERPSTLVWLSIMGVVSFVLMNTYIFMTCDCLPDSMVKMRSKLFRMNIDLARSMLERQPSSLKPAQGCGDEDSPCFKRLNGGSEHGFAPHVSNMSYKQIDKRKLSESRQRMPIRVLWINEHAELDRVWSLYDQLVRLSDLANFKLTARTYYSKRCLLWIFGRTVSLILLCIQIVDIYSYT